MSTLTVKDNKPAISYQGTVRLLNAVQKQALSRVADDPLAIQQLLQDERFINGYRKQKDTSLTELEPSFTYEKNGWLAVPTADGTFIINSAMTPDVIAKTMARMSNNYTVAKDYYIPATKRGINPDVADKQAEAVSKTKGAEEIMKETGMTEGRVKDIAKNVKIPLWKPKEKMWEAKEPLEMNNAVQHKEKEPLDFNDIEPIPVAVTDEKQREKMREPLFSDEETDFKSGKEVTVDDEKARSVLNADEKEKTTKLERLRNLCEAIKSDYADAPLVQKKLESYKEKTDIDELCQLLIKRVETKYKNPYDDEQYVQVLKMIKDIGGVYYKGRGILDEAYDKVEYETGGGSVADIIEQAVYQGGEVQKVKGSFYRAELQPIG